MEELALYGTVSFISSVLGCGACIGFINYIRRQRGEPIYCSCCLGDDNPEVAYTRLDEKPNATSMI